MDEENQIPEIGTPEYDEYMIKVADAAEGVTQEEPQEEQEAEQPELPEGVSMDDLLAAWKAQNPEQEKPEEGQEESAEEKPEETGEEPNELDSLKQQVKELQEQQTIGKIYEAAGGEDAFNALKEHAEGNLDETQMGLLNMALVDGTPEQAVAAVNMLRLLFDANPQAPNQEGKLVSGRQAVSNSAYSTEADFHADLQNPLYNEMSPRGEAYRQKVMQKLQRSSF